MKTKMLNLVTITVFQWAFSNVAIAGGLIGIGEDSGSTLLSDGERGYIGAGDAAGRGWTSDGQGNLIGTGENAGSTLLTDGEGGYIGSGEAFGGGWYSDSNGDLYGTGKNTGRTWLEDN